MMESRIFMLPVFILLVLWFTGNTQSNTVVLSAVIFVITAIGILQLVLMILYKIERKLEAADQVWLRKAQRSLIIPIYLTSGLSALILAEMTIGLLHEKEQVVTATRIYCRQTSNVPGRPSTERLLLKGRMCLEIKNTHGSVVYAYELQNSSNLPIGAPTQLIIITAESFVFGVDAYLFSAKIKK